jgi:hypothetical protein
MTLGKVDEAIVIYRNTLNMMERLAAVEPKRWELGLIMSHWKLALAGDESVRRIKYVIAGLGRLKAEGRLPAYLEGLLSSAEKQLVKFSAQ